jgi:hypothetical protein
MMYMSKTKEPTIRERFEEILNTYDLSAEHKAFIEGRIEVLTRKSTERKPTAKQMQNAEVAKAVYEQMESNRAYTVGEMVKVLPAFQSVTDCSSSYANAIVKKLKDSGMVIRTEVKGRAYFTKVEQE